MKVNESKKVNNAINDLNNANIEIVNQAISTIKSYGNELVLEKLVDKIIDKDCSSYLKKEIIELLNSLKLEGSQNEIIRILSLSKFSEIKQELISTIWNSKLDYSNFLDEFVKLAVDNDFLISLDCLSVIENMQGPFKEEQILDSKILIKNYFEKFASKSEQKDFILKSIFEILENLDRLVD